MRYDVYRGLRKMKLINNDRRGNILRFNNSLKALLTQQHNLFEGFSIRYFGPIDGHDVNYMIKLLNDIKGLARPQAAAYQDKRKEKGSSLPRNRLPNGMHRASSTKKQASASSSTTWMSRNCIRTSSDIRWWNWRKRMKRIVGITPAMPTGSSMIYMMKAFPQRAFDVGIAEGHSVTFSAGLAKEGMIPFCNVYSSFMQRAYDNLIHDVALQKLHMVICLDRAGLVGEDGATHHGVFDLAYLRPIPNPDGCLATQRVGFAEPDVHGLQGGYGHVRNPLSAGEKARKRTGVTKCMSCPSEKGRN